MLRKVDGGRYYCCFEGSWCRLYRLFTHPCVLRLFSGLFVALPLWFSYPLLSSLDRLSGLQNLCRIIQVIASSILYGCRVSVYTKLYQSLGW